MQLLIIEDDHDTAVDIEKVARSLGLESLLVDDAKSALELISRGNINVVVVGMNHVEINGIEFCKRIRNLRLSRYVYILCTDPPPGNLDVVSVLNAGADEYIIRPFDKKELAARIAVGIRIHQVENRLINSQKKLLKLTREDPLTKTLNRRALLDEALKEMNRSSREKIDIATILVEVDNLKSINEKHGNLAGDLVLVEFARRLEKCCREYDKFGRFGDREFLLVLPKTGRNGAQKVAERILSELSEWPLQFGESNIDLKASVGVCSYSHDQDIKDQGFNEATLNELLKLTESALRRSREEGVNRMVIYTP